MCKCNVNVNVNVNVKKILYSKSKLILLLTEVCTKYKFIPQFFIYF